VKTVLSDAFSEGKGSKAGDITIANVGQIKKIYLENAKEAGGNSFSK
jgi:hypothetical protein